MSAATLPALVREPATEPGRRRVSARELAAVSAVAAAFLSCLVVLAWNTGVTVDEPAHFLSGRLYWEGRDNLQPGDKPPLMKIVSGWAPLVMRAPLPPASHSGWKTRDEWNLALALMETMNAAEVRRYFFAARLPMLIFPLGCCLLMWWWGRQIFPPWAALGATCVFCMTPTVLGHGALVKNDLAAAFGYLLFWYRAWRYWREPRWPNAAWLGAGVLAAILAKFSLAILLPIGLLIVAARRPLARRGAFRGLATNCLAGGAIIYLGLLAAWQFRLEPISASEYQGWKSSGGAIKVAAAAVRAASVIPTPGGFWRGGMSLLASNRDSSAYLLGRSWPGGNRFYFLVVLAVKLPVPIQLLLVLAAIAVARRALRRGLETGDWCWMVPGILYLALASLSALQLGIRLIMPALVFLAFAVGSAFEAAASSKALRIMAAALLLLLAGRTAQAYPNYISYFNFWVGDSWRGLRILSDSNMDWGQGLRPLKQWYEKSGIAQFHLAYFGTENPFAYFNDRQMDLIRPPWNPEAAQGRTRVQPTPGYYAISATLLTGHLFAPEYRDFFAAFRERKPVAQVGGSIFIFRIS